MGIVSSKWIENSWKHWKHGKSRKGASIPSWFHTFRHLFRGVIGIPCRIPRKLPDGRRERSLQSRGCESLEISDAPAGNWTFHPGIGIPSPKSSEINNCWGSAASIGGSTCREKHNIGDSHLAPLAPHESAVGFTLVSPKLISFHAEIKL